MRTQALTLDGTLRTRGDGLPDRFALTGRIAAADGAPVLLPLTGPATRIDSADLTLGYDSTKDEGWSGRATLQGLQRETLKVGQVLMTGSGRIRGGSGGNMVGATVQLIAAGLAPTDPALAEALGQAVTGEVKLTWQEGKPLDLSDVTLAGAITPSAPGAASRAWQAALR